jgi:hypothetical protein
LDRFTARLTIALLVSGRVRLRRKEFLMRFSYSLFLMTFFCASLCAPGQENSPFFAADAAGIISGTVLDAYGQLAGGARVCISLTSGDPGSGQTIQTACPISADKYGEFQLDHLKIGTYTVAASEAGDQFFSGSETGQKITITATSPYARATLRLRPGGVLLGSVIDAVNGKPVKQFQVQYIELDDQGGGASMEQHGKFRVVVPVATDLVVIVTARGYKGWVYTDSDNRSHPVLRLASGEQKEREIELQPLFQGNLPEPAPQ